MAGEIQIDSVTALTASGSDIVLNNVNTATNRTNLGLGSIATQNANAIALTGGSLTGTEIDLKSSGTTIYKSDGSTAVISESSGTVTVNNSTLGSAVTFPAGHILQINSGVHNCGGDVAITTTSEAFGPVVSMQMVNANAKVLIMYSMAEAYSNNVYAYWRAVYKTTSFTAGDGNTSHGASQVITPSSLKQRMNQNTTTVHLIGTVSNTANQTLYFAAEGAVFSGSTFYANYSGPNGNIIFTVMEIQQ